ncbi:MAG: choice-of-anchor D domain-containing protein, partial [Actinobacteria bacterium]|nr:choice-of-anchor D domain-containing protein [Actinomycetota bacterium]
VVSLSGTGTNSHFVLTPSPLDFGNVYAGQSKTLTLTFSNPGTDDAHITGNPSLVGPNAADFAILGQTFSCPQQPPRVPAGSSCGIQIKFTPSGTQAETATLTLPNDSSDGPQTITFLGSGINPQLTATAPPAFGPTAIGGHAAQDVTVKNTGTTSLVISSASISSGGDYTAGIGTCASPVPAGGTCVVHVTFSPTVTGSDNGTLKLVSNAQSSPDSVALSGSGIDPKVSGPASTSFGGVQVGSSSTQSITLTSSGTTPLTVGTVSLTGTSFSVVSDGCSGQTVTPGSTCTVQVKFTAASGGHFTGTLTVPSNALSSPDTFAVNGDGLGGIFSAAPTSVQFGAVIDNTLGSRTVTISNTGSSSLSFAGISVSGGGGAFTVNGGTCTQLTVLAVGGSCTVVVGFVPPFDGAFSASLHLTGNGQNSPFDVPLAGTGASPGATVSPHGVLFGVQPIVGHVTLTTPTQFVTVTSTGTAPLTISSAGVTGKFIIVGDGCSGGAPLPNGTQCQLQIAFVPTSVGLASGTLTLQTNAGPLTVSLSGFGVDTTPPVIGSWQGPTAFNATSPSGSVVSYTSPTAVDAVDGTVPVMCTPVSGSTFAIGATTITCTASDTSGNTATATFTITVVGALPQIANLEAATSSAASLQGSSGPVKDLRNKLLSDLAAVSNALTKSKPNTGDACHQLGNFVHDASDPGKVQPKGPLSPADSAFLVGEATRISHVLGC